MKYQKIPTKNLGTLAYYLLQITQGIFKWNGELFFCPFVTLENKQKPFQIKTWANVVKNKKWSLPFIDDDTLFLFADPVHPSTYLRTEQRSMDKSLGINNCSVVLKKGKKLIIKNGDSVNTLEFVKKLSDNERKEIFDPSDHRETELRHNIWKTSKHDGQMFIGNAHKNDWLRYYENHMQGKKLFSWIAKEKHT